MKRAMQFILTLAVAASMTATGQTKQIGVGLIVGAPTGLSVKYWSTRHEAIQAFAGGGFGGIAFGADYVFHSNQFENRRFRFYYGPGVFVGPASYGGPHFPAGTFGLGARFIFGVDYTFPDRPFDLAFELGPAILLSPSAGIGLEGGLAFRFYP